MSAEHEKDEIAPMSDLSERIANLSPAKRELLERKLREQRAAGAAQAIPRRSDPGPAPLSLAQERLWFLDQLLPGNTAYVIADGEVGISVGAGDTFTQVSVLGTGQVFGELALLTSRPRTANAVARSDVDVMVIDRDAFRAQVLHNPES